MIAIFQYPSKPNYIYVTELLAIMVQLKNLKICSGLKEIDNYQWRVISQDRMYQTNFPI